MDHLAHVAAFALGCFIGVPLLVIVRTLTREKTSAVSSLSELKRVYEWRFLGSGSVWRRDPEINACMAWLLIYANAGVTRRTADDEKADPEKKKAIGLFVASTGERISVEGKPGSHAQLYNEPDLPCFDLAGRTIKKPESA